MRLFFKKL